MINNINNYGVKHQKNLYNKYGDLVIDEYVKTKSIKSTNELILKLGPANVSLHCANPNIINVFDISPSSINNIKKFENYVKINPNVSKYITPPNDPGFHLQIPQPKP